VALKPIPGRPGSFVDEETGKEVTIADWRIVYCFRCMDAVGGCRNCERFTCSKCGQRKKWSKAAYVDGLCVACWLGDN
jgi:hypothetical protein